jgi:hypothetical protein
MLTIEVVDKEPMLVLTYKREFVKGYHRKNEWQIPIHAFYELYIHGAYASNVESSYILFTFGSGR